jgi:hypothetical protein
VEHLPKKFKTRKRSTHLRPHQYTTHQHEQQSLSMDLIRTNIPGTVSVLEVLKPGIPQELIRTTTALGFSKT